MVAIIAAVLFGLALIFQIVGYGGVSIITAQTLTTAGLLCVALHMAGVGNKVSVRSYRRRR